MTSVAAGWRLAVPGADDLDALAALWEASVRASHAFLAEEDIDFLRPLVRGQYLPQARLLGALDERGEWLAFMGTAGDELEALFVHPRAQRRGIGRALAEHAVRELGVTRVDVNEQNPGAVAFYRHLGFVIAGRSATDGQGRPFPVLHLRLPET